MQYLGRSYAKNDSPMIRNSNLTGQPVFYLATCRDPVFLSLLWGIILPVNAFFPEPVCPPSENRSIIHPFIQAMKSSLILPFPCLSFSQPANPVGFTSKMTQTSSPLIMSYCLTSVQAPLSCYIRLLTALHTSSHYPSLYCLIYS